MKHEHQETVTRTWTTCDFCGERDDTSSGGPCRPCCGCGKDACSNCGNVVRIGLFRGDYLGDYSERVCDPCLSRCAQYAADIAAAHDQFDTAIDMIERKWKEECMNGH